MNTENPPLKFDPVDSKNMPLQDGDPSFLDKSLSPVGNSDYLSISGEEEPSEEESLSFIKDDSSIRRVGRFELPDKLMEDESDLSTDTYAKFIAEPFEVGFGHTVGNSLRRVLLNSIEGAAFVAFKMEGVQHEFQSLDGVVEDVIDIVLNLKNALLISYSKEPIILFLNVEKEGPITLGDIEPNSKVEIVNPDHIICTLDEKRVLKAQFEVHAGRGYVAAKDHLIQESTLETLAIDALFSPVRRVNYTIEETRVGKITNFDKLILKIWTDGRVTPKAALHEAAAILRHHLNVFDSVSTAKVEFDEKTEEVDQEKNRLLKLLGMSVNELELSVRAANCLNNANILTLGELVCMTESDLMKYRNFGKKSCQELKAKCQQYGLHLGMKLDSHILHRLRQQA